MKKVKESQEMEEIKQLSKAMTQFVVIGLGKFGATVAKALADLGNEVLAIDKSPEHIHQIEGVVSDAVVAAAD